jgi:MoaA/NifB/PqqE/SkfB family radical SAM enzyme
MNFLGKEINRFHLEVTTNCVLSCPACQRTGKNDLPLLNWDLPLIQKIFPLELKEELKGKTVTLSGTYGDPIYNPQILNILTYLKGLEVKIQLETNGAHRVRSFWFAMSEILGPKDEVVFSIDGMEDTLLKYRVGGDWKSAMDGMSILVNKCNVIWKWIVFSHNEHQIEEGLGLAREIGCSKFKVIKSARFHYKSELEPSSKWLGIRSKIKRQLKREFSTRNRIRSYLLSRFKIFQSKTVIIPQCLDGDGLYINAKGEFSPCCNTGTFTTSPWFAANIAKRKITDNGWKAILENQIWNELKSMFADPYKAPSECLKRCGVTKEWVGHYGQNPDKHLENGEDVLVYSFRD